MLQDAGRSFENATVVISGSGNVAIYACEKATALGAKVVAMSDSNGYIFEAYGKSLVYVTDTGYINVKYHKQLQNKTYYIMESNHDVELLMHGRYPYHLKQRIIGDKGHLSNKDSAYYLSKFVGSETKGIVLIHLSEENNDEEIALKTLYNNLEKVSKEVDQVIIAHQTERTDLIEV